MTWKASLIQEASENNIGMPAYRPFDIRVPVVLFMKQVLSGKITAMNSKLALQYMSFGNLMISFSHKILIAVIWVGVRIIFMVSIPYN